MIKNKFIAGNLVRYSQEYMMSNYRLVRRNRNGVVVRISSKEGYCVVEWEGNKKPAYFHQDHLELLSSEEAQMIIEKINFSFTSKKSSISQDDVVYMEDYYKTLRTYRDGLYAEPMNKKKKMDAVEAITAELARVLDWIIDYKIINKIA
jgi:hypothetical protein